MLRQGAAPSGVSCAPAVLIVGGVIAVAYGCAFTGAVCSDLIGRHG
jgi:hypothetical protein